MRLSIRSELGNSKAAIAQFFVLIILSMTMSYKKNYDDRTRRLNLAFGMPAFDAQDLCTEIFSSIKLS